MKTRLALLTAMVGLVFSFQPALAQDCSFQLGFKALHDLIPDVVGDCLDDEQHNPATGITQQSTTNGQLTWRKADNWTGFTDGQRTWINGPEGLQQRLNSERFPWEAALPSPTAMQRLTLEQLRNAEYRLPLLGDQDTPIRLIDGMGTLVYGEGATERETVGLIDDAVAFGDLDGDGNADAAVAVYTSGGGSGAFIYLVAVLDRYGAPAQAARAYLGDRVRVDSLSISDGRVFAQILAHAPLDGLCCPSLRTTRPFALRQGGRLRGRGRHIARAVLMLASSAGLPGLRVYPVSFTPEGSRFAGELCHGVFFLVTDRDALRPVRLGLEVAAALHRLHGDAFELDAVTRLFGSRAMPARVRAGDPTWEVAAGWEDGAAAWRRLSAPYLLYD